MPASRRGNLIGAVALGAACLLAGCDGEEADSTGAADGSAPPTVQEGPVAATEIAVGDCLNGVVIGAAERAEISSVRVVPCNQAHGLEVYATFELGPSDFEQTDPGQYPGPARVVRVADERCAAQITALVEDPDVFGLIAVWPSPESWSAGDRRVACAIFAPDGSTYGSRQL